jgi:hypothetical protein
MVERGFLAHAEFRLGRRVLLKREALLASTAVRLGPPPGGSRR